MAHELNLWLKGSVMQPDNRNIRRCSRLRRRPGRRRGFFWAFLDDDADDEASDADECTEIDFDSLGGALGKAGVTCPTK